jgi:hypothetical protein
LSPQGGEIERKEANMSSKIRRILAALAALAALALGGAAIAGATGDSSQSPSGTGERTEAPESAEPGGQNDAAEAEGTDEADSGEAEASDAQDDPGDGDGELAAADEQRARTAAEQATGGQANGDVEPAEQADPGDRPTPANAAYEVEVESNGQALKVFLDSSFHEIGVVPDAG